jgi:HlyD family secretion protein
MTRKKTIIAITLGLLLLSGVAFTIGRGQDGLAPVAKGDVVREVVSPGVVEPQQEQVALAFETAGRITEMLVQEGERVAAGQVLARLDERLALSRVARAEAALDTAIARRDATLRGARPDEVRAAEADAEAARANAWEREQQHARSERLFSTRAVSASERDGVKGASDVAHANAEAAEARLKLIREGARSEVKREAMAAVKAAAAELDEAKTLLAQTELKAPKEGVILRRLAEPGEQVTMMPPKVVLTLADLDRLQLRVEVDENDVGQVKIEQRGFASADAYGPRRFPGKVVRLMGELGKKSLRTDDPRGKNDTRVLEAIFVPDEPSGLPLGLRMDVHIETVARHDVLTVPIGAVSYRGEQAMTTVLESGEKRVRDIKVGADNGIVAEVVDGLSAGEIVAVR